MVVTVGGMSSSTSGEVVLKRNWPKTMLKYDLEGNAIVVFKLEATGFKLTIYKSTISTSKAYSFLYHG